MRRAVALALLTCWGLLTGCTAAPQSREVGRTAVVSVLAAESDGDTLTLYGAAEGREGGSATTYTGSGQTPAAALSDLTQKGALPADLAHVEHVILEADSGDWLPQVLSYALQDPRQSTETQIWVLKEERAADVVSGAGDLAQSMGVVAASGKSRQGFAPVTLRDCASLLAADPEGGILLPALVREGEELAFGGYGLWREGEFVSWVTGEAALGVSLLTGEPIAWTDQGVALTLSRLRVVPQWRGETLVGLTLRCTMKGTPAGGWSQEALAQGKEDAEKALLEAAEALQRGGTDCGLLRDRAGLSELTRWESLWEQWQEAFSQLTITGDVTIAEAPEEGQP